MDTLSKTFVLHSFQVGFSLALFSNQAQLYLLSTLAFEPCSFFDSWPFHLYFFDPCHFHPWTFDPCLFSPINTCNHLLSSGPNVCPQLALPCATHRPATSFFLVWMRLCAAYACIHAYSYVCICICMYVFVLLVLFAIAAWSDEYQRSFDGTSNSCVCRRTKSTSPSVESSALQSATHRTWYA